MNDRFADKSLKASNAEGSLGFGLVLRGLRRHPVILFLFVLLAGGAAAITWIYLPLPKMTGYSILQIKAQPDFIMQAAGDAKIEFQLYRQTQSALIKSRLVLNAAVSLPEMNALPAVRNERNPINWVENQLKVDFKIGPELMKVSIEGDNADELKTIITAVTESYLKEVVNKDKTKRITRMEQLSRIYQGYEEQQKKHHERLLVLAQRLATSEPNAAAIKERYIQEEMGNYRRELSLLERELLKFKSDAQFFQKSIEEPAEEFVVSKEMIDAALFADSQYQRLLEKQRTLASAIDQMKKTLAPDLVNTHPGLLKKEKDLKIVDDEITAYAVKTAPTIKASARDKVVLERTRQLNELNMRIGTSSNYKKTLEERLNALSGEIKNFKIDQVNLEQLKTKAAQTEKTADKLLSEIESMRPEMMDTVARVSVWEDPVVVPGIEGNRRLKYGSMVFIGILFMGLAVLTGMEFRSRRIAHSNEVASGLGLQVIGTVPPMPKRALGQKNQKGSPMDGGYNTSWQSRLMESVDNTRTLLLHGLENVKSIRTIMITSALSGEGKTSFSGHIALSLARAGFKTLLVDADMRRPSLHKVLAVPLSPGLSDLLRGDAALADVIRPTPAPGLSVIPAGLFHVRLQQILAGSAWMDIKSRLEVDFDYVVVDTPPLLPVADTLQMARHVDGVILSLLHDVSRMGAVTEAKNRLMMIGANILGVVINGVASESYGNPYGYYYYRRPVDQAPTTPA